jgi:hypothetical protein
MCRFRVLVGGADELIDQLGGERVLDPVSLMGAA